MIAGFPARFKSSGTTPSFPTAASAVRIDRQPGLRALVSTDQGLLIPDQQQTIGFDPGLVNQHDGSPVLHCD